MVSEGYLAAGYEYVALDDCELRMPLPRLRPVPAAAAMLVVFQQCLPLALFGGQEIKRIPCGHTEFSALCWLSRSARWVLCPHSNQRFVFVFVIVAGWQASKRSSSGHLVSDPKRFPPVIALPPFHILCRS